MLVEPSFLSRACRELAREGAAEALSALARQEPVLDTLLAARLGAIPGKLPLSGAPARVVQGSHEEMLALTLTCLQALRRGHFQLWKDTMSDTRLAQLDPSLQTRPRRRRNRKPDAGPDRHEPN